MKSVIKNLKKEQILIGGLFFILLLVIVIPVPETKEPEPAVHTGEEKIVEMFSDTMEERLQKILERISGVGAVEVLITYEDQGKIVVEKDESVMEEQMEEEDANGGTRTTTTIQKDWQTIYGESEAPYVIQEISPTVSGVLVVAQGAGKESVKKQIQETIEALFGLDAHKISIMKMEVSK